MNKLILILSIFILLPNVVFCQDNSAYTTVKTRTGDVKIPGNWELLNTVEDSGQTYLKNKDGVIIAIAQNLKKAYPFFKNNESDFENVKMFYAWDSEYYIENKFKTDKIKENSKLEYVIWKYNDNKLDNVFLFGTSKNNFLNLLIYTNQWTEDEKIIFLENLYKSIK